MATASQQRGQASPPAMHHRRSIRITAAALSAFVGVLYLVLMFLVARVQLAPGVTDNRTYVGYLVLAIAYLLGAGILFAVDRRILHILGAGVQVVVIVLFVLFGIGLLGPGVFEQRAISHLPLGLWAAVITAAQISLLALLAYLADESRGTPGQ
ncbi:MAG: hypothetical protein L0H25_09665 [Micrococcales bacterium]|nr:hypothetical protein [Micrococcales bacterium]